MFSWSGETPEDLRANSGFIQEMGRKPGVITYISFVTPHPGSGIENEAGLHVLTRDYSRYTHKQPVAVPRSLGDNGLRLMVNEYHRIAETTGTEDLNPRIDSGYLRKIGMRGEKAA